MAKSLRLRTEPAAVADIRGQDFALELFALTIVKQDLQLSRRFQSRHNAFLQSPASVHRRLQGEPVIGMRSKRDDITRFPDRAKQVSTENLHGHAPHEPRKIQLRRLREARKIRYHHDGLVFPPAKERQ